jgi:hypothetical protein
VPAIRFRLSAGQDHFLVMKFADRRYLAQKKWSSQLPQSRVFHRAETVAATTKPTPEGGAMARVADYVIIRDAWKLDMGGTNPITFTVPDNIHTGSRCVLNFMFNVDTSGDMILEILINGHEVWNWKASGAQDPPMRCIQEVVAGNVVKPGENLFQWHTAGDWRVTELSDIVLWFQANT